MDGIKKLLANLKLLNTREFWVGFIAGLFYFGWIFWWVWALYPLSSLGIASKTASSLMILFVFVACIFINSIFWGLFGFFSKKLIKKSISPFLLAPSVAGLFTLTEYARAIFFSIFWFGSGGVIGPHWPLGNLAYLFIDFEPIAITASIWGIYGINFLILGIATTLIFIILKIHRKIALIEIAIFLAVLSGAGLLAKHLNSSSDNLPKINLAIIQTNTPSDGFLNIEESLKDMQTKLELLNKASAEIGEGIIVFPEGTNLVQSLSQFLDTAGIQKYFNNLSKKNIFVVDSIRVLENDKFKSRAVLIDSQKGALGFYDKQILTPAGEFLPYIIKFPLSIISPSLREQFKTYREYSNGSGSNIISPDNGSVKIIICSELISPSIVNRNNADYNIIIGSSSIWQGSPIIVHQGLTMSRFRAIETGKYTSLASNYGRSFILNPLGKIEKISSPNNYELLTGSIVPNHNRTWYNYVGDWPILLLSSVFFGLSLRSHPRDPSSTANSKFWL